MSQEWHGRQDQSVPILSARDWAVVQMVLLLGTLLGSWHAAVVLTTGTRWGDLNGSVKAAFSGKTPETSTFVACGLLLVLATLLLFAGAWFKGSVTRKRRGKGLADRKVIKDKFGVANAQARATTGGAPLRPSLPKSGRADVNDLGFLLGTAEGTKDPIVVNWDDHISVVAPTGAGKSRDIMIPAAQTAPGALVVTTNEATILDAIAEPRRGKGRIWVFDPLGRTHWPEPMVWDPVAGCKDGDRASARGAAFCAGVQSATVRGGNEQFFADTATTAMETMLHAAALDGRTIRDVLRWALEMSDGVETPRKIIDGSEDPQAETMWSLALKGVATGADDTVASTRTTLQRHIKPLLRRSVLRWVDPSMSSDSSRITETFDPIAFVQSTDTLVLVSDDNAPSDVGPLCSMLFQEVMDAVKKVVASTPGQRLEPPLRVAGDEIANVAPIPRLPAMATEVRKMGVQMILAFQDDRQATSRWGEDDGMKLLNSMGVELVLPGVKSGTTLERFSKLTGEVEVIERTTNLDISKGQGRSVGLSTQVRPVMRADEVRRMADGTALAVYRNVAPFLVHTIPWWEREGGAALSEAAKQEAAARAERARTAAAAEVSA